MRSLLIYLLLSVSAHAASPLYKCEIDQENGNVTLNYTYTSGTGNHLFAHRIGRENFIEPFKMRVICADLEKSLNQLNQVPQEQIWIFMGCGYDESLDKMSLRLTLSEGNVDFFLVPSWIQERNDEFYRLSKSPEALNCQDYPY